MMKIYIKQEIAYKRIAYVGLIVCLTQLFGCGEFAYKRGGNATELQHVRGICQTQSNDQKQFENCLAEHGWAVQHLNTADPDPVIEATYEPDNRQMSHSKSTNTEPTQAVENQGSEKSNKPSTQSMVNEKPSAPKQPTDLFHINSWWKLGNNSTLNTDIQQCVDQLGSEHQPDKELHHATRALLQCMNTKGWKALREK